jgi:hypothetical protein
MCRNAIAHAKMRCTQKSDVSAPYSICGTRRTQFVLTELNGEFFAQAMYQVRIYQIAD